MQNLFSYPIIIEELSAASKKYDLAAASQDLEYLAEVLKVPGVKSCSGEIWLQHKVKEHKLFVKGSFKAVLTLQSVVSLEYFDQDYAGSFELLYDTKASYKEIKELEVELEEDVPEVIIGGKIDLGDILIEQVALQIDDYPRRPGEVFEFSSEFDEDTTEQQNPFNILKKLKK